MPTTEDQLKKLAALSHIGMNAQTTTQLVNDVGAIMDFVEQLRSVDTSNVTPLLNPHDSYQQLRQDIVTENNNVNALANIAPVFENDLYLVPKVIETGK